MRQEKINLIYRIIGVCLMSFAASTSINANEILLKCNDVQYKEYEEPRKQFEIVINIDKNKKGRYPLL
jgi:hypothetical protein